ncbi:MAG: penicillin-binding protein 2 [Thermodesulfobacteriota bacterium]
MRRLTINKAEEIELELLKKRLDIATVVVITGLAILIARLWFLQIHKGDEFADLARRNRIRAHTVMAPRGTIFDAKGRKIVTNQPCFNVVWNREDAEDPDAVIKHLSRVLGEDVSVLLDRIRDAADDPRHLPVRLKENIDWPTLVHVENVRFELPGSQVEVVPRREYLYGDMASHLIGYLAEISQKELEQHGDDGYEPGDLIGKMGVEKLQEPYLRGEKGKRYLEVDVHGNLQRLVDERLPVAGNDLVLTLDADLQLAAERAMADRAGAVVAMDVNSGRLLALASAPGLTLADFLGGISRPKWDSLQQDPLRPLLNKTIQGQYPPGSTYKIVTALAGLAERVITPETSFFCGGSLYFGNRSYGCWKKGGHGQVSLHDALVQSCDVYFYQVGLKVGVDALAKYANSLGLGLLSGIDLENEKPGLIPTAAWKARAKKVPWQEGETLSIAIGQGFDLVTPLQLCRMMAAVANGGTLYRPQFIEMVKGPDGQPLRSFTPIIDGRAPFTPKQLELVKKALAGVVNEPRGTGSAARLKEVVVGGKTGTAQVVRLARYKETAEKDVPLQYRDHAWFVCFAPVDKPEIAVAVLVEHGGHGGSAAGPVANAVLKAYFNIPEAREVDSRAQQVADAAVR